MYGRGDFLRGIFLDLGATGLVAKEALWIPVHLIECEHESEDCGDKEEDDEFFHGGRR